MLMHSVPIKLLYPYGLQEFFFVFLGVRLLNLIISRIKQTTIVIQINDLGKKFYLTAIN